MSMTPSNPTPRPGSDPAGSPGSAGSAKPDAATDTVHHKDHRRRKTVQGGTMQLNMTSMIDVVFLLLIYFVITASFVVGEGVITANFPTGSGDAPNPLELQQPINVIVSANGQTGYRLQVDKSSIAPSTFGDLMRILKELQSSGLYPAENPVIIQPSGTVRWQHVVNAFNAAVAAEYKNIAFAQADTIN